ncbi:TPA: hypothetical protein ACH3X3_006617 [Trebouxia sp. C0006]
MMNLLSIAHKVPQLTAPTTSPTQDKVLIKLSSCGEMINVQLLANPAAVAQEEAKRMDAAITRLKHSNRIKSQEQALRNSIVKYHSSVDKAAKQLGRACATQKALLQSAAGASNTTQFVRQAEEGLAAAVDEAGSLLDTVPVIRGWLQAQLQDCLASCSDSQGHEGIAGQGTLILDPGVVEILSLHKKAALELKAAHCVDVAAFQEVVAGQAQEILRLKWQHGNANVAASQLSLAYQRLHLQEMQASKDQRTIIALKNEVRLSM